MSIALLDSIERGARGSLLALLLATALANAEFAAGDPIRVVKRLACSGPLSLTSS